jgi:cysteinyl-tRNA synthetase
LRHRAHAQDRLAVEELAASLRLLGFLNESAAAWDARKREAQDIDTHAVEALIAARATARKSKNFAESDRIRDELLAMGVVLKDSKDGTTWELAR